MLTDVVRNQYYDIAFNPVKNRMYLRIKGFWKDAESVRSYVPDLQKGVDKMKPGFTLMVDLRGMKTPPLEVNEIHKQAQLALVKGGLLKTAEVLSESDLVLQKVLDRISQDSMMPLKQFTDPKQAEAWLKGN